jgi:2-pyrone-4,6-dicarboxylate lactonase
MSSTKPTPPSFHPSPSKPTLPLPPKSCDAHFHIFGPQSRFPFPKNRSFTPSDAPKEKLFAMHATLGIERGVIVQSGCHGFENDVVADALADRKGAYRGIALLPVDVADEQLAAMNRQGFCGVRFHYMKHLGESTPIADVIRFAGRLEGFGWHLQIHAASDVLVELGPMLKRSPVPVVIDHMGRVDASLGIRQPAFQGLLGLMDIPHFWVKVSGSERASQKEYPYSDAIPFARKLVTEFGDRVLWGTDWPHPNLTSAPPDDGQLVDLIKEMAPTPAERQKLLVDNPFRLYRFKGP